MNTQEMFQGWAGRGHTLEAPCMAAGQAAGHAAIVDSGVAGRPCDCRCREGVPSYVGVPLSLARALLIRSPRSSSTHTMLSWLTTSGGSIISIGRQHRHICTQTDTCFLGQPISQGRCEGALILGKGY